MNNTKETKEKKRMLLFRLPYPYSKSQIYMPTDLYLIGSRLEKAGIEAKVCDLNLHPLPSKEELEQFDSFGIGAIGAPYIPKAINLASKLQRETHKPLCIGGPGIEQLHQEQFNRLFGHSATQVKNDSGLVRFLDISQSLPDLYSTSIAPLLDKVSQSDLKQYLLREFALFVSQGCKFGCDFCGAKKRMPERFTQPETLKENLEALAQKANSLEIHQLSIYISSLDLFQTPKKFVEVLRTFVEVRRSYNIRYNLRGLSRVDSFLNAVEEEPALRNLIQEAGLKTVGFGVDGTTEKIWHSQHKGQKSLSQVDRALDLCTDLNITPELLMVMGFPQDNFYSLLKTYAYTMVRAITHGAVSRPYLAKSFIPGNDGWTNPKYSEGVESTLRNPQLFANLDFAVLGSPLTHTRRAHRYLSNLFYGAIAATLEPFGRNATYPLMSTSKEKGWFSSAYNSLSQKFNEYMPFDK